MSDISDQQEINRLNALVGALVKERGEAAMRYNDAVDDLKAAEAQAEKLKEALEKIADSAPIEFVEIAERALEGK